MLSKNVKFVTQKIPVQSCIRLAHSMKVRPLKAENGYLHNPGSEPLNLATLGDVLQDTAHKYPGRIAIKSVHENLSLTYEQLLTKADALGCALRTKGFEKGDRLGIWSHNNVSWIVSLVAAARAGFISVLINPLYEKDELSFCIRKTKLKGIMIGDKLNKRKYYDTISQVIPELRSARGGHFQSELFPYLSTVITAEKEALPGTFTIDSLISDHRNEDASRYSSEPTYRDGCLVHFTSGTTSAPKAALDSHIGIVNNIYYIGKRNLLHEAHQTICVQAPLFHALGSIVTTLAALRHGSSLVLPSPTYNAAANLNALLTEKCTVITGTPTMYVDLVSQVKGKGSLPFNLRVALAAAAPCSPQLIHAINTHLNAETVKAALLWNALPEEIRKAPSKMIFRRLVRERYLEMDRQT